MPSVAGKLKRPRRPERRGYGNPDGVSKSTRLSNSRISINSLCSSLSAPGSPQSQQANIQMPSAGGPVVCVSKGDTTVESTPSSDDPHRRGVNEETLLFNDPREDDGNDIERSPGRLGHVVIEEQSAPSETHQKAEDTSSKRELSPPGGTSQNLIEYFEVDLLQDPPDHKGYFVARKHNAPAFVQEWSQMHRLEKHEDLTHTMYMRDDIVQIHVEPTKGRRSKSPQYLGKIIDIRSPSTVGDDHDVTVLFLIAWFNTKQDAKAYEAWKCANLSAWPCGKQYVLTTQLQVVDSEMTSRLDESRGLEHKLATSVMHDVVHSKKLSPSDELEWKLEESSLAQAPGERARSKLSELENRRAQLIAELQACDEGIAVLRRDIAGHV